MSLQQFNFYHQPLSAIKDSKVLINTINAQSYNVSRSDTLFQDALLKCNVLIPDGISVVWSIRWLTGQKIKKIAGADLFLYEMERLQQSGGRCFFLGSCEDTLTAIKVRAKKEYPSIVVKTCSPPYEPEFTAEENDTMIGAINSFQPDALFVGMTAPKQEKWAYQHFNELKVGHVCCIGAVFDFYAGTVQRAPQWMINIGLEWFYRFIQEPRRMWRRYLIGNSKFIWAVLREKYRLGLTNKQGNTIMNQTLSP